MKRLFLLLISSAMLLGTVYLLTVQHPPDRDPLELVSRNALLVLDWNDAAGTIQKFPESGIGKALTDIDWPDVLEQMAVDPVVRAGLRTKVAEVQAVVDHVLFQELFSRRSILALLPPLPGSAQQLKKNAAAFADRLLLLVQPGHGKSITALRSLFPPGSAGYGLYRYQGSEISVFEFENGKKLFAVFVDGQLAISPGLETIRQVIDLSMRHYVQETTGFALNEQYRQLKARALGRDDFFLYADLERLRPLLKTIAGGLQLDGKITVPEFSGMDRVVFFHLPHKRTNQFAAIVRFTPDGPAPFQRTIYSRAPVKNYSLANMPSNLLVYFWSNWLDLAAWWRETLVRGSDKDRQSAARIAAWIKEKTTLELDDFLALFGCQFGFNIAEIRTSGFIPVPRICACVEVTDSGRVRELIEKMLAGMPLRRDKVAGIPVVSIMAANGLMQPSYTMLKKFLVVADSRSQIEEILRPGPDRLIRDDAFTAVDMGMLQPANLLIFARVAGLVQGLKEMASWAGTIIAIRDPRAGEKSKILIDQVILPLLDGLKTYRALGIRSYTAPGEVVLESVILTDESEKNK
jgi:predicted NUDIX family NTP pyrophosphohydrolase